MRYSYVPGVAAGSMGKTRLVRRIHSAGIVLAVLAAAVLAGCGSGGGSTGAGTAAGSPVAKLTGREMVTLKVPARMKGGELSSPHQLEVPKGWTASVWARVPGARMEAVTPEGNLLVSVPERRQGGRTERQGDGDEGERHPRRARIAAGPRLRQARRRLGPLRRRVRPDRLLPVDGRRGRQADGDRPGPPRRNARGRRHPPPEGRRRRPRRHRLLRRRQLLQRLARRPRLRPAARGDRLGRAGRRRSDRGDARRAQRRGAGAGPRRHGLDRDQQPRRNPLPLPRRSRRPERSVRPGDPRIRRRTIRPRRSSRSARAATSAGRSAIPNRGSRRRPARWRTCR